MYYIAMFGALKRKNGESVLDFIKRFNKMYNKIVAEIKPTETSTKITFADFFEEKISFIVKGKNISNTIHYASS